MMQHVLERRFDRHPIILVDVRVQTRAHDVDLQGAAGDRRLLGGDEFGGAHLRILPLLAFVGCETV